VAAQESAKTAGGLDTHDDISDCIREMVPRAEAAESATGLQRYEGLAPWEPCTVTPQ
jgi:hypothetical protein